MKKVNLAFVLVLMLGIVSAASAATYTVTNTLDAYDGVCDADCSFYEAVRAADDTPADDVIVFAPALFSTPRTIVTSESRQIYFAQGGGSTTINGPGANLLTISGQFQNRILRSFVNLTINGVTLANAYRGDGQLGGAIYNDGATLTLNNVVMRNCKMVGTSYGGGIYNNNGTVNIINSTLDQIAVDGYNSKGGGIYNRFGTVNITNSKIIHAYTTGLDPNRVIRGGFGGTIYNEGTVNITGTTISDGSSLKATIYNAANSVLTASNSTFIRNRSYYGGVFLNETNAHITLTGVTISDNRSEYAGAFDNSGIVVITETSISRNSADIGGALINRPPSNFTMIRSAMIGNSSHEIGGAVLNEGTFNIYNSSLGSNSVTNYSNGSYNNPGHAYGGAIFNAPPQYSSPDSVGGFVNLYNATIGYNLALGNDGRGGGIDNRHVVTSRNSLISENFATGAGENVNGPVFGSNTIIASANFTGLRQPADNGGPTQTMALRANSPAIDGGNNANAVGPDNQPLTTDQRGLPRYNGARVDVGAYEALTAPFNFVVDNLSDDINLSACTDANSTDCSLRGAIQKTNETVGDHLITFVPGIFTEPRTIQLTGTLNINGTGGYVWIEGPGANLLTIAGNGNSRVFRLGDGGLTLDGLTITNGRAPNEGQLNITRGGGVWASGNLAILDCIIRGNTAPEADGGGGAIYNRSGQLTISNSSITGNTAALGGGIYNESNVMTVTNSSISVNNGRRGGGVYNDRGEDRFLNTTLSGNYASEKGGGIYAGGTVTLRNSTIAANRAGVSGGGVFNQQTLVKTSNTIIGGNTASTGPDLFGDFNSFGYNLIGDTTGINYLGTTEGNITNVSAMLGPLTNNGGLAPTMALLSNSPAINNGSDEMAVNINGTPLISDQRGAGYARIDDGRVDIGAFEVGTSALNLIVDTTSDSPDLNNCGATTANDCSLRGAIARANLSPVADNITFDPALSGQTITLVNGWNGDADDTALRITSNVTISGPANGTGLTIAMGEGAQRRHIYVVPGGGLTISNLTLKNGKSPNNYGGSIFSVGSLAVSNCTFTGNSAGEGGAIQSYGDSPSFSIENSTFTNNSATNNSSAIHTGALQISIKNVTITGNNSANAALSVFQYQATMLNTIVAGNTGGDIGLINGGGFTDQTRNNLVGTGGSGGLVNGVNGNLVGVASPGLLTLSTYGGPTQTVALAPNSPAIDAGTFDNAPALDQRGKTRLGATDIGAFEAQSNFVVTNTLNTGAGSLRSAIAQANASPADEAISFDIPASDPGCASGVCTIKLTGGELVINSAATSGALIIVNNTGAANLRVSGNNASRVFNIIENANATINGLTITGGNAGGGFGGGIAVQTGAALTVTNSIISGNTAPTGSGGGFANTSGTVNIVNSTVSGNSALVGGGITSRFTANLTVQNSTVSDNTASNGGGIYVYAGNATILNSTISGNSGNGDGGGVYSQSTFNVRNTIIAGNLGAASAPDFRGNMNSLGYNLIGNATGGFIDGDQTGNIIGTTVNPVNARLAPLGFYGGQTQTRALLSNSPAINAGTAATSPGTDQRGVLRVGTVDIGAFELSNANNGGNFVATLPSGKVGLNYSQTLFPEIGGTAYCVSNGVLPDGLSGVPVCSSPFSALRDDVLTSALNLAPTAAVVLSGAPTLARTYNFAITATNGGNTNVTNYALTIEKAPSTITINSADPNPSGIGQAFAVAFTVAPQFGGTPTGNVTISDGVNSCSASAESGICALTLTTLGTRTLTAVYAGDANFSGSSSNEYSQTVNKAATAAAITSESADPTTQGQTFTVFYNVAANGSGNPTGNVTVSDGVDSCTATVASGQCSLALSTAGNRVLTATYDGDANFNGSVSAGEPHAVAASLTLVVDTTGDDGNLNACTAAANDCSLRGAISRANDNPADDVINFDSGVFFAARTITLTNGQLTIANNGTVTINGTRADRLNISGNNASRVFEVSSGANLTLLKMTVSGGREVFGGGINNHGMLAINTVTVTGNAATGSGGGINSDTGTVTNISNSAITNNTAANNAGGLYFYNAATVNVFNTTVSGNSAGNFGGGIANEFSTIQMTNATVTNNTGAFGGGVYNFDGSMIFARNDLIANNTAPTAPDFSGTLTSQAFNLIGNTNGTTIAGDPNNNRLNVDAKLLPLSNYGGETPIHALLPDSPAINAGTAINVPDIDQRGRARVGATDIGAFEAGTNLVVTNTANSGAGSLSAAFAAANGSAADESIAFAIPSNDSGCVNGSCTINLNGGLTVNETTGGLIVSNNTSAANLVISANQQTRVLTSNGGNLAINGLTLTGGQVGTNGRGGGIYSSGSLVVMNSTITGNAGGGGSQGGGIYNENGMLTIANTTISSNTFSTGGNSTFGGAIFNNNGPLTITNSTLSGNLARFGGAICNTLPGGVGNLTNVTISGNSALRGGGIYNVNNARINAVNVTITGNSAFDQLPAIGDGGGVLGDNSPVTIRNTIIAGNSSSNAVDVRGPLTSRGYNLIGRLNSLSDPISGDQTGNLIGTNVSPIDPKIAPLGFYGGKTLTHALLSGSPAINGGNSVGAPALDQRGASRVGTTDIGAFEFGGTAAGGGTFVAALPNATQNIAYSHTVVQNNGSFAYSISGGNLPNGLSLTTDPATNGAVKISGTPTETGTFNFSITATSGGNSIQINYTLTVNLPPTPDNYSIAGSVIYGTNPPGDPAKFVPGVSLAASGTANASALTNSVGAYGLNNLPIGSYIVTPSKTGDVNAITSFDASLTARRAAGSIVLTQNQLLAADVSGDGTVSSFDASMIARTAAGTGNIGTAGQWKFVPATRTYTNLATNLSGESYQAILMGEVSGNWVAPGSLTADNLDFNAVPAERRKADIEEEKDYPFVEPESVNQITPDAIQSSGLQKLKTSAPAAVNVTLPANNFGAKGATVVIPINVGDTSGMDVFSYDFVLAFDPAVLQPATMAFDTTGTLSGSTGFIITPNPAVNGQLTISGFGTQPLSGAGTLLNLRFTVVGTANTASGATNLNFPLFRFNEGTPTATATGGMFRVTGPTAANVSVSGRVMTNAIRGLTNAVVTMTDASGNVRSTQTGKLGYFHFDEVGAGQIYIFQVNSKRYTFAPQILPVNEDLTDLNFTAQ